MSDQSNSVEINEIEVEWTEFKSMGDAYAAPDDNVAWKASVYVIATADGLPLYIGKAAGGRWQGIGNRYEGDAPAMDALALGTSNRIFVGRVVKPEEPRHWYAWLEELLVAREAKASGGRHPRFNTHLKNGNPNLDVTVRHTGAAPRFAYETRDDASSNLS